MPASCVTGQVGMCTRLDKGRFACAVHDTGVSPVLERAENGGRGSFVHSSCCNAAPRVAPARNKRLRHRHAASMEPQSAVTVDDGNLVCRDQIEIEKNAIRLLAFDNAADPPDRNNRQRIIGN